MLKFNKNKYIVSDIETDGLLNNVKHFWCAWIYDSVTKAFKGYTDLTQYVAALEHYGSQQYNLVFHNGINYDIPAIKKLMGRDFSFDPTELVMDTLVIGRLVWSNVDLTDIGLIKSGKLPAKLRSSHSLKAYGYRLGELKGTYGEQDEAWDSFSDDMYQYCKQDVNVTRLLYEKFLAKGYPMTAVELEHEIAWVMAKQERNGIVFDKDSAIELYSKLLDERNQLNDTLTSTFGSWQEFKGMKVYKRDNAKRGIKAGVEYPIYVTKQFNPNSRGDIAKVLMERGWQPEVYTPTGEVKVDEQTLETAKNIPETALILRYLLINKRISQLADGDNAWLKEMVEDADGYTRIHGSVNPNGAVTGRATHSKPNMAQVPAAHSPYGKECRSLFGVPKGWLQAGIDASGLELRCFGHFLSPFDDGAYIHTILNGDIHTANQKAAGLPTRDNAKTFIYGFLYGAGNDKIGSIIGKDAAAGKKLKEKFLKAIPAIKQLRDAIEQSLITESTWSNGTNHVKWRPRKHPDNPNLECTHSIIGLDKRIVYVRSPHSALNTILQSAGALICKAWVVETIRLLTKEQGLKHGWNGDFALMAWVHDEIQVACRNREIAETVVETAQRAMRNVQQKFNFKCQLDTEGKIGANWYETH